MKLPRNFLSDVQHFQTEMAREEVLQCSKSARFVVADLQRTLL